MHTLILQLRTSSCILIEQWNPIDSVHACVLVFIFAFNRNCSNIQYVVATSVVLIIDIVTNYDIDWLILPDRPYNLPSHVQIQMCLFSVFFAEYKSTKTHWLFLSVPTFCGHGRIVLNKAELNWKSFIGKWAMKQNCMDVSFSVSCPGTSMSCTCVNLWIAGLDHLEQAIQKCTMSKGKLTKCIQPYNACLAVMVMIMYRQI